MTACGDRVDCACCARIEELEREVKDLMDQLCRVVPISRQREERIAELEAECERFMSERNDARNALIPVSIGTRKIIADLTAWAEAIDRAIGDASRGGQG